MKKRIVVMSRALSLHGEAARSSFNADSRIALRLHASGAKICFPEGVVLTSLDKSHHCCQANELHPDMSMIDILHGALAGFTVKPGVGIPIFPAKAGVPPDSAPLPLRRLPRCL